MSDVSIIDVHDAAIHRLLRSDAQLECIAAGLAFTEGPLWMGDHLLFSDLPNNRICRWQQTGHGVELSTWRYPSGGALDDPRPIGQPGSNGLTLDRQRRLIACEHGNRRVTRTEDDGAITVLADRYEGKKLNSPNDAVVRSDGSIFFSDPPYGLPNQGDGREQDVNGFYRIDPDGQITRLVDDFERPNGLAFSPDERTIYLADTRRRHLRAFDVSAEGALSNDRVFLDMEHTEAGGPDGLKVDVEGNVYVTGPIGVWVASPAGKLLGIIRTPERPANCGFGDTDWRTLFITAREKVYRIKVEIPGIAVGQ